MHAVIVDVEISDAEKGQQELRDRVIPMVRQAPGFVAGYWMDSGEGRGHSVVVFQSEEAARGMASGVRSNMPEFVTLTDVDVYEVVASA